MSCVCREDEASGYTLCSKFPRSEPAWCATRWGPQERVTHSLCLKTTVGSLAGVGGLDIHSSQSSLHFWCSFWKV